MSVSYDRLAERIDELIFELSLINSELNELRKRICLLNHSENIAWKQISLTEVLFRTIFLNITTPVAFQLFLNINRVDILVNGKIQGNLIIK